MGVPPTSSDEYQNKALTKFAFRKLLILKDAILVVLDWQDRNGYPVELMGVQGVPPPIQMNYQNKALTKFAFRKLLILKDAILVVLDWQDRNGYLEKEKREQAPALYTQ